MLSCIFGKCSSETYVVNKDFTNQKSSIVGTRIASSKETEYPVVETRSSSENQRTNIEEPVTHFPAKQNGQITASMEEPNRIQVSQNEDKNHKEVSSTIQTAQTSTAAEKSNSTHSSTKHVENLTAATEITNTQISKEIVQNSTTLEEKRNSARASETTQATQISVVSNERKNEQASQIKEETSNTQILDESQITQNNQSATVSELTNSIHIIEISKSENEKKSKETQNKKSHAPKPPVQNIKEDEMSKSNENGALSIEDEISETVKTENVIPDSNEQAPTLPPKRGKGGKTSKSNIENGTSSVKHVISDDVEAEDIKISTNGKRKSVKEEDVDEVASPTKRRSGLVPIPVNYDEDTDSKLPVYPKSQDDEALIRKAIERNDFLNKIISGKRLEDVVNAMYNKEISARETVIKQGEKGSHMYISAKGTYQIQIKNKVVNEFNDVRVFGELALLYNAKRLATIKALTPGKVWVLDRNVYQQITVGYNIKKQDETMQFLMNSEKLKVVGKEALQEVSGLLKSEFFKAGTQIVRQGDKGNKFYIISAGTVTITKDGQGIVGLYKKGDCFGELALLKEDCRQATVTADAPGVECLTLTRKQFVDHFGDIKEWEYINVRPQDSFKDGVTEHEDIDLRDLKIIKTLGVGGFGRVELVQHKKKNDLVFALKYLKKIDIVVQHQQEHVYNEKNIQMACKSPFIVRLYRTYKDNKYIYLLMESCLGGDLWSLLQKQKLRRFDEKEARFIAACVLESFEYLHTRGIIYRDLKPENLLIAANGYIKLTDFGFAKKISSRGKTFTFAGTPEYVAPEIVLNRGHDRSVDYWAFGAFIFELLTGRTPFRTDDSSHMKTYNKILSGIDNVQFPSYVNLKARHIVEKLCRPVPSERLGMQKSGIKAIKDHKWFLGFDWQKFSKCEVPSPFRPRLRNQVDTQYFDQFKKDTDIPPDELSGWDNQF